MNGLLALFVFIAVTIPVSAQKLVAEGNVWTYTELHSRHTLFIDGIDDDEHTIILEGDTIVAAFVYKYYFDGDDEINDKAYKRLWRQTYYKVTRFSPYFRYKDVEEMDTCPTLFLHMREEGGKVYVDKDEYNTAALTWRLPFENLDDILECADTEYIIYDWNKDEDDVLPFLGGTRNLVFPNYWITLPLYKDGTGKVEHLNLFYRNGVLEYKSPQFYSDPFFPDEVADGIEQLCTPVTLGDTSRIYNLQGQRMAQPQTGLNIVGGRKVLVR